MSAFAGPQPVPSGLVFAVDASSPKSYSQNVIQNSTDLYALFGSYGVNTGSTIRDTSVTDSPVGGVPLKLTSTGTDAYIASYNSMASNLATAVTGQTWTVSFYAKASSATTSLCYLFGANSSGGYIELTSASHSITTTWQRFSFSLTMSNASTAFVQFRFGCSVNGGVIWFDGLQLERSSSVSAFQSLPNANGTSWYDLSSGKRTLTSSGFPVYNYGTNPDISFNGSSNYFTYTPAAAFDLYCLEFWMYNNNVVNNTDGAIGGPSSYQSPINFNSVGTYGINLGGWTGGAINEAFHIWSATAGGLMTYNRVSAAVGWHHVVFNWNGTTYDIWLDGVKTTTYAHDSGHAKLANITSLRIGGDVSSGYYFNGKLPIIRCYNTQISDTQVLQNFNALRGRYGI
jgi:hypothetical protein